MHIEKLSEDIKRKLPVGTRIVFNTDIEQQSSAGAKAQVLAHCGEPGEIIGTERARNHERYWAKPKSGGSVLVSIRDFDVEGQVLRGAAIRARAGL